MNNWKFGIAFAFIFHGAWVFFNKGEVFSRSAFIKYDDYVTSSVIYLCIGIFFLLLYMSGKPKKKDFSITPETLICPMCGTPYGIDQLDNKLCPICKIELEELEGFFDRHPEHK
jgi:hypothetical protein